MDITSKKSDGIMTVLVSGRMDAVSAPEFDKIMSEMISAGDTTFVVDLNNLDYISSAGLRSILVVAKKLKAADGKISFTNLKGMVKEVFDISGFGSMFSIS